MSCKIPFLPPPPLAALQDHYQVAQSWVKNGQRQHSHKYATVSLDVIALMTRNEPQEGSCRTGAGSGSAVALLHAVYSVPTPPGKRHVKGPFSKTCSSDVIGREVRRQRLLCTAVSGLSLGWWTVPLLVLRLLS